MILRQRSIQFTAVLALLFVQGALAAEDSAPADSAPTRPAIEFNRWQEDWSVLADTRTPREAFDDWKYIRLSADDFHTYLSLGANVRERFEANDATNFGVGNNRNADYDISRVEIHADLRWGEHVQVFSQLQSDYAINKAVHTPVDQDRLDLEQEFIAVTEPLAGGSLKVRLGRQEIGFDLQRFVASRDGPNVRQAYDAAWFDYEHGSWRYITFYSHPVQDRDQSPFDDYSSHHLTFGGFRVEHVFSPSAKLSSFYARFTQDSVAFLTARGDERRDVFDVRFAGEKEGVDWDLEAMEQSGRIGSQTIEAWAFGSLVGYTLHEVRWEPRFGLQVDAASGDKNPTDHQLNTFNPLFPNGYYVTLSGYTGFVNFIHVKPSFTVTPTPRLKIMAALGAQWRETTADAVYTQPDIPVAGTAGRAGRYTGTYGQLRLDSSLTEHVAVALEVVHFKTSEVIHEVGGHDSNYVGAEVRYGW